MAEDQVRPSQLPAEEEDLGVDADERPAPHGLDGAHHEGEVEPAGDGVEQDVAEGSGVGDPTDRLPEADHIVSPDDPDDPARAPETLGIDNTDTALGAEDDSAPVE